MANDFKDYMKNNRGSKPHITENDVKKVKQNFSDAEIKNVEEIADRYSGMSESQLMGEISRMAAQQKRSGKLTDAEIDNFTKNVLPMLDDEQKKKLGGILRMLKK